MKQSAEGGRDRRDRAWTRKPICTECHKFIASPADAALVIYSPDERQDQIAHREQCFVRAVLRFNSTFKQRDATRRAGAPS